MTGAMGDSFGGASVHVGPDGWALCHTYSGGATLPSLYVHAGRLGITVYLSGETIIADHVRFSGELAKAAEQFAAECARMHDARQASNAEASAA
ncbi:MAG TPA: hypothetical protein VMV92_40775 [Streptosporangiaceae bacterium]|nr:hypothetical protein [Streptosporangiaceae bacterium]